MRNKLILILAACQITVACSPGLDTAPVRTYIAQSWDATLRYHPVDTPDSLIGLPRPYTVPCAEGMFNELYYWDTFFTNEGLLLDGQVEVAKDNTEDILCLIDRYGFMPNGNRLWYLSRSQPPYACLMVEKVYEATADTTWLRKAFPLLEKEYGKKPMIYGTTRSYNMYCAPQFNNYPLYIGRYGIIKPIIIGSSHYVIWQYSESGHIEGIPNAVDLCRFHPRNGIEDIIL